MGSISNTQTLLRSSKYWAHFYIMLCHIVFRYFVAILFAFFVINMAGKEACEKKIRYYGIFFTPLHVYKERRKLKTNYLQDRVCLFEAPKVILGTRFFSVLDRLVSSNYKPKFFCTCS